MNAAKKRHQARTTLGLGKDHSHIQFKKATHMLAVKLQINRFASLELQHMKKGTGSKKDEEQSMGKIGAG